MRTTGPFILPKANGPHAVGCRRVQLQHTNTLVSVFYPAQRSSRSGPQLLYLHQDTRDALKRLGRLPRLLSTAISSAYPNATPLTPRVPRPAVLLSPGLGCPAESLAIMAQEAASHGLIAMAVAPDIASESAVMLALVAQKHLEDTTFAELQPQLQPSADARKVVLDAALCSIAAGRWDNLCGEIDAARVAVGGHSLGGGIVAAELAVDDCRVSCAFNLDGGLSTRVRHSPPSKPVLILVTGPHLEDGLCVIAGPWVKAGSVSVVHVPRASHCGIVDSGCLAEVHEQDASALCGEIGANAGAEITQGTAALVTRFVCAALGETDVHPTSGAAELVKKLPGFVDASTRSENC